MNRENKYKLDKILASNNKWPIIVEGATKDDFFNSIVISANIESSDLGVVNGENGIKMPQWLIKLNLLAKNNDSALLIIDDLDKINKQDQSKFIGILKYKSLNGINLPNNIQILVCVKNIRDVDKNVQSLCLIYKAE